MCLNHCPVSCCVVCAGTFGGSGTWVLDVVPYSMAVFTPGLHIYMTVSILYRYYVLKPCVLRKETSEQLEIVQPKASSRVRSAFARLSAVRVSEQPSLG